MKKETDMFNFLKRLFGKRAYMTNLKPCPCCGGRHILFKPAVFRLLHHFVCDDCGFRLEGAGVDYMLEKWSALPRNTETNHV